MKRYGFRAVIGMALVALTGLLVVQVYWFVKAYNLQERQFDERVNLALRRVTDQLLGMESDTTTRIAPIRQTASNAYHVDFKGSIPYARLDSLVKITFQRHEILSPFELMVYEDASKGIMFGNFYKDGFASSGEATCLTRYAPAPVPLDFGVTFPQKQTDVIGAMGIWIFSAITFLLILVLFGFLIIDLSRQKKLSEVKADFINNMTHELQTPIANISIASEVLRSASDKSDPERVAHYAHIIYEENKRLKFQVEQVLQTALLEKGQLELKKSEVNLNSLIEEVVSNFRLRVQSRQGQIRSRLDALQPVIFGDHFHLTNILYSLLDNADKYSPSQPDITVSTTNQPHGVRVCVEDKGIGMEPEEYRFIFDKFYRVGKGNVHDVKGFGLGLTYVHRIVLAHHGSVSVTSAPGRGSAFELYFQLG